MTFRRVFSLCGSVPKVLNNVSNYNPSRYIRTNYISSNVVIKNKNDEENSWVSIDDIKNTKHFNELCYQDQTVLYYAIKLNYNLSDVKLTENIMNDMIEECKTNGNSSGTNGDGGTNWTDDILSEDEWLRQKSAEHAFKN